MIYFVDTNIIIAYVNRENTKLPLFIEDPENKFYYTETVKKELDVKNTVIPKVFQYAESGLTEIRKANAFKKLTAMMTIGQTVSFKPDMYIIFESGFKCYDVIEDFNQLCPRLISRNHKLYKKFIQISENKEELEIIINYSGFEHLMSVVQPEDLIDNYKSGDVEQ